MFIANLQTKQNVDPNIQRTLPSLILTLGNFPNYVNFLRDERHLSTLNNTQCGDRNICDPFTNRLYS